MDDNKVILKKERYSDDSQFWCPECHILMQYSYVRNVAVKNIMILVR